MEKFRVLSDVVLQGATNFINDILGMRDYARFYYQKVLDSRTSYPARVEARRYLRKPYKVNAAS